MTKKDRIGLIEHYKGEAKIHSGNVFKKFNLGGLEYKSLEGIQEYILKLKINIDGEIQWVDKNRFIIPESNDGCDIIYKVIK